VLRDSGALLARMGALATQERAQPGGASDTALRRLATPAALSGQIPANVATRRPERGRYLMACAAC